MKSRFFFLSYIILLVLFFIMSIELIASNEIHEQLSKWSPGYLDIHHINTGKGEAALFILPDGTTMLIDAGATNRPYSLREAIAKPNSNKTPGEWISRYVAKVLNNSQLPVRLNYILLTHFHDDHMGGVSSLNKISNFGKYELSGITEVGENIKFDKIIDRAWPSYDYPLPLKSKTVENYKNFIDWQIENNGVVAQKFQVGKKDQLKLVNNPEDYPNFEVRNIAASGIVWTGTHDNAKNFFPPIESLKENFPDENMLSIALRLSYGKFDYFTGGDLLGNPAPGAPKWQDIETPVGQVVGPVEVNVANHHAHYNAQNEEFISFLRPKVHIIQSWVVNHPAPSTLERLLSKRLYPGDRDIFITNLMENTKIFIGSMVEKIIKEQGHIVIRVEPGGDKFYVYVLDDSNEEFLIKAKYGPYLCE